jgi:hypothetical protein
MHGWIFRRRAESSLFASSSLVGTSASDVALVIIVLNIRKGVVFTIKWLARQ